jgi:hypothetical protein
MQRRLSDKFEAVAESLGILFPGSDVTLEKGPGVCIFRFGGDKVLEFGERLLASHDVDFVLTGCHAAAAGLKENPDVKTVQIGEPAAREVAQRTPWQPNRRKTGATEL